MKFNRAECGYCRKGSSEHGIYIKVDRTSVHFIGNAAGPQLSVPSGCPCWGLCLGESSRSKELTAGYIPNGLLGVQCALLSCSDKLYCKGEYLRVVFYNNNKNGGEPIAKIHFNLLN